MKVKSQLLGSLASNGCELPLLTDYNGGRRPVILEILLNFLPELGQPNQEPGDQSLDRPSYPEPDQFENRRRTRSIPLCNSSPSMLIAFFTRHRMSCQSSRSVRSVLVRGAVLRERFDLSEHFVIASRQLRF